MRRQTSYPRTSGRRTSRITSAGCCRIFSKPWRPVEASSTEYPALRNMREEMYRFSSRSSTIRMCPVDSDMRPSGNVQTKSHRGQNLRDPGQRVGSRSVALREHRDRLKTQTVFSFVANILGAVDDHRNAPSRIRRSKLLKNLEAGHIWHEQVEEDHVRMFSFGNLYAFASAARFQKFEL